MADSSPNAHHYAQIPAEDLDLCWLPRDPSASEKLFRGKLDALGPPGADTDGLRAELLALIARAEAAQGKLTEARVTLDLAAKVLAESTRAAAAKARIRLLVEEGRLYVSLRTPSQARARLAAAWELAVASTEDSFMVDIARLMAEIEPMKLQEEWIHKAIGIAERSTQAGAQHRLGDLYADLGWRLFDLRQFESSLQAHQRSLESAQKWKSASGVSQACWAMARLFRQMNRVPEALALNEQLLLEMSKEDPQYGRLCEETGECLLALKRPEAAETYFARAHRELSSATWIPDRHPLKLKRLKDLGKVT